MGRPEADETMGSQVDVDRTMTLQAMSTAKLQQRLQRTDEDIAVIERQFLRMDKSLLKLHRRWEKKRTEVDALRRSVADKKSALDRLQEKTSRCLRALYPPPHLRPWRADGPDGDLLSDIDEDLSKIDEYLESVRQSNAEEIEDGHLAGVDEGPAGIEKCLAKKAHK